MGRRSQTLGQAGEYLARYGLAQLGYHRIQRIHTGWKLIRFVSPGLAQIVPGDRVDGDFTALTGDGRAVLVEAKVRSERLRWSDLAKHQREALDEYKMLGAVALVAWIDDNSIYLMEWPCLARGQSIDSAKARELAIWTSNYLSSG